MPSPRQTARSASLTARPSKPPAESPLTPGAAYVFVNPSAPNGWTSAHQSATLTAQSGNNGDGLGSAVSVSDNGGTIVVGAPGYGTTTPGYAGTAYVFQVPAGGWTGPLNETQILTPSSTSSVTPTNAFGHNASISGDASTIGVGGVATVNSTAHSQVVYMFQ